MPIYEYACRACEHEFETLQKLSEAPLVDCPQCGAAELRKKVSAVRFRLKGGGWYETDFKSGDKKNLAGEAKADKESTSDSTSGDSTSGDSAPGREAKGNGSSKSKASSASGGDAASNGKGAKTSGAKSGSDD